MIKSPRGTRDLLPPDTALWNFVEAAVRDVFRAYNFHEIRTPIFESTELFARGVGEETDIVSKEMFTWEDRGRAESDKGQSLTLRPENTAGVVRAYIEHKLWDRGLNKLFYIGPQFRRERPQKGRYRQFYQIGAEVIGPASAGSQSPARDAEILELLATLLDRVGITGWTLELNSVGVPADRAKFNEALRLSLAPVVGKMCADCQRRAVTNPLRIFDCKVPEDQPIIATLPTINQFLSDESRAHYEEVKQILNAVQSLTLRILAWCAASIIHAHCIRIYPWFAGRAERDSRRRTLRRFVGSAGRPACSGNRLRHRRRPAGTVPTKPGGVGRQQARCLHRSPRCGDESRSRSPGSRTTSARSGGRSRRRIVSLEKIVRNCRQDGSAIHPHRRRERSSGRCIRAQTSGLRRTSHSSPRRAGTTDFAEIAICWWLFAFDVPCVLCGESVSLTKEERHRVICSLEAMMRGNLLLLGTVLVGVTLALSQAPSSKPVSAFDQQLIDQQKQFLQATRPSKQPWSTALSRTISRASERTATSTTKVRSSNPPKKERPRTRAPTSTRHRTERRLSRRRLQPDRPRRTSTLSPHGRHLARIDGQWKLKFRQITLNLWSANDLD